MIEEGYQGRASVGHLGAFHDDNPKPIIKLISEDKISVMALLATDFRLGIRDNEYNVRRAVTPIRKWRYH